MDLLAEWIETFCESGPAYQEITAELYKDYLGWCEVNAIQRPLDNRTFGRKLAAKGYGKTKIRGRRGFKGIKVAPGNSTGKYGLPGSHMFGGGAV